MKKLLSWIIICVLILGGLAVTGTSTDQKKKNIQRSDTNELLYEDELDQSMTDYNGTLPLGRTNIFGFYANLSIAQSFIPQREVLTRTQFLMARNASTSHPCLVAIRDNLTAEDLAIVSVQPSEFPIINGTPTEEQFAWIEFNFDDIWVTPGQTYFIVLYTANITNNYYWISGNGTNIYQNGTVFLSINDGQNWTEFVGADGCFKTYGLHETFLQITMKGGFGSSFIIKNIGNYTAWDVTYDSLMDGGLIFIGEHSTTNISELLPGQEMTLKQGFVLGFGKVIISLRVSAANVKEMSLEKSAVLLLFFLLGIK